MAWYDSSPIANFFVAVLVLLSILCNSFHAGEARCLCSVTKNGEYCGNELNDLNSENECPKDIFFCGDSNRDKEAMLMVGKSISLLDLKNLSSYC